jgi:hypothetical protein
MGINHHCVFPMAKAVGKMGIYNTYVLSNMGSLNPISFNNMHSHNWPLDLDKVFGHWPPIKTFLTNS